MALLSASLSPSLFLSRGCSRAGVVLILLFFQAQSLTRGASLDQSDPSTFSSPNPNHKCGNGVGNFPYIQLTNLIALEEGSSSLLDVGAMVHGCVPGSNYRLKTSAMGVASWTKFTHMRSGYELLQVIIDCADLAIPAAASDTLMLLHFELFGDHPAVSQCSVSLSGLITSASYPLELSGPLLSCKNAAKRNGPSESGPNTKKEADNSAEQKIETQKSDRSTKKRKQISSLNDYNFHGQYQEQPDLWMNWWPLAFEVPIPIPALPRYAVSRTDIKRASKRMNNFNIIRARRNSSSIAPDEADDSVYGEGHIRYSLDIPAYVMNLPSRKDRRSHMERLLPALGFTDIRFPETTLKSQIDVEELLASKAVHWNAVVSIEGMEGRQTKGKLDQNYGPVRAYLANALDQIKVIQDNAQVGTPLFAILEDDLMPAAAFAETNRRIADSVAKLPPTADMLFLEYCLEDCARLRYPPTLNGSEPKKSDDHPVPGLAIAHHPFCSGGIVFTVKGARKLARLLSPVFSSLDAMYAGLAKQGYVEAYVTVPPIFYQDSFWGSDANRTVEHHTLLKSKVPQHTLVATACMQFEGTPVASRAEAVRYGQVAGLLEQRPELQRAFEAASWWAAASSTFFLVFNAYPLMHWAPDGEGSVLLVMPSDRNMAQPVFEEVAVWEGPAQERIAVMVDERSYCWPSTESEGGGLCLLELYRAGADGARLLRTGFRVQLLVEHLHAAS